MPLNVEITTPTAVPIAAVQGAFSTVNSRALIPTFARLREHFLQSSSDGTAGTEAPVIGVSSFIPLALVAHLMRRKKDLACGQKYNPGDAITNMEAVAHHFITPLARVRMTEHHVWDNGHSHVPVGPNQGCDVIMSAAVQPDFEYDGDKSVMLRFACGATEIVGRPTPPPLLSASARQDRAQLAAYDQALLEYYVYSLMQDHRIPARSAVQGSAMTPSIAKAFLAGLIAEETTSTGIMNAVRGQFVNLNGNILPLELFLNTAIHQVRNEARMLEATAPQGYVNTINPPAIFATAIGRAAGAEILNRFQALGLRIVQNEAPLTNLKEVVVSAYQDPGIVGLLARVLPASVKVKEKAELFPSGRYAGPDNYALVIHNNSDGFGQNIQYEEGDASLDAVVGRYSNAACCLLRRRPDLLSRVVQF